MVNEPKAPKGWSVEPLAKCVDVLDSRRIPVNSKERASRIGSVPYYGAAGQAGWIDDYLFDEELVLLGEDGAPFLDKSKPIAYIVDGKSWVNNHAHVLRARHGVTSNRYIKHYLDLFDFTEYVQGSTRDKLTQGAMNTIPVVLAPYPLQDVLVRLIDRVAEKRTSSSIRLASARRAIDRFRQAVLTVACSGRLTADWRGHHPDSRSIHLDVVRQRRRRQLGRRFREPHPNFHVEVVDLPATWEISALGLLLSEIKYGTSKRSEYGAQGVPVLRIPNVSGKRLDIMDLKTAALDPSEAESLSLRLDDLLMIRSNGSVELVGKTLPVTEEAIGMAYAGYLMRLRTDDEALDSRYLALVLASPQLRRQIEIPARSTSGVNNINTQEVRGLVIPLPPIDEQREIVHRATKMFQLADDLLARIHAAARCVDRSSQAVLARAFRGDSSEAWSDGARLRKAVTLVGRPETQRVEVFTAVRWPS
jgi:type I restriction enzyme S subunit